MPRLSWRPPQRSTIICSESAPLKIWWRNTRWRWKVSLSCVNKILNLLGSVFTYSIISTYFSMKSGGIFWIYSCKCIQNQNCSYRVDFITRVLLPCSDASTCGVVLYILLCVGVVIFKKFDEGRAELTEGLSVKSIVKFVESKAVPLLTEFSQEVSSPSPPLRPALSPSLLRLVLSPPPLSFPHPSLSLLHSLSSVPPSLLRPTLSPPPLLLSLVPLLSPSPSPPSPPLLPPPPPPPLPPSPPPLPPSPLLSLPPLP